MALTDDELQRRALHVIVMHFDETGKRISDAELATALHVSETQALAIRDQVEDGERGWY